MTFAWQAWHLATSGFTWQAWGLWICGALGRRDAAALLRGRRGTWRHLPSFHVAGVALGDIHLRFAWQAWYLWDWAGSGGALGRRDAAALLRGRRGTWRHLPAVALLRGRRGTWRHHLATHLLSFHVAGVALTSTFVSRGRRSTYGTGLALVARLGAVTPRHFCVAGVALGDICLRFTWQAWHLATSTFVLRGRRGTYGTGLALVARLGAVTPRHFCVAGVALGDICLRFTWQALHLVTSTFVLRGRRGTWRHPTFVSRGRHGTWRH